VKQYASIGLLMAVSLPREACAAPITGIARALDGDSLEVSGRQVRLFGIDAPEYEQSCNRNGQNWSCGAEAAEQLAKLVTGREIFCTLVNTDEYQRAVSRCSVMGRDINSAMVESGYAIAFRQYSEAYVPAESRARAAKRGLWSGTFVAPQQWRNAARQTDRIPSRRAPSPQRVADARPVTGCTIKGNRGSNGWIYHLPGMPYYGRTKAEEMFCSEAAAQAAGYRRARAR
jgi:endonuclease YncB( thermonuclease family)